MNATSVPYEVSFPNVRNRNVKSSMKNQIEQFGQDYIVPREQFLCETLKTLVNAVHMFVIALFNSSFALYEGCKNDEFNDKSIQAWKETGETLLKSGILFIGIISPVASEGFDSYIAKTFFTSRSDRQSEGNDIESVENSNEGVENSNETEDE
jgi:hypothetical protein